MGAVISNRSETWEIYWKVPFCLFSFHSWDAAEKWRGSFLSAVSLLLPGTGRGSEAREKGAVEGWVAVGDSLLPPGALPAWRALDWARGSDFYCFILRVPLPAGENFWPIRKRQPGQPDHVHGFSGWHLSEPNHVANVSYLLGGRKEWFLGKSNLRL